MTLEEIARKFDISLDKLRKYEEQGLLKGTLLQNGEKVYSEKEISHIAQLNDLFKAGFSVEDVREYMDNMRDEKQRLRLLRKYRNILISELHQKQKSIENLDYIIAEIKKKEAIS
ncbi:MAG: MerR family transcriptional regulator [Clostridia bacterium]|nr:MerR family transcriptional regulator [Lachnospiraceae bacterium]NCB99122.1 MerR family transcriptional regulator [Clostridia bacterium]NCD02178.1 MerR family transcriptional regulator [Clostridia bacterium]